MKVILIVLLSFLLVGCPYIKEDLPPDSKMIIPAELLKECKPKQAPMSIEAYMQIDPISRENYLTDYILSLLTSLSNCDAQIFDIKRIYDHASK